jgi:hypothetical protein
MPRPARFSRTATRGRVGIDEVLHARLNPGRSRPRRLWRRQRFLDSEHREHLACPGWRKLRPAGGVPGEIIIVQRMRCAEAVRVAQAYFESGKAPRSWRTGSYKKGWDCWGRIPGKRPVIAQCGSYSTAASAQTTLARVFEVRPQ